MKDLPDWFKIQFFVFLGILAVVLGVLTFRFSDIHTAQQAEEYYHKGEAATTIFERKNAFNQALEMMLKLDSTYHPNFGSGKLEYNIGNTYFQLTEYPHSILYYERAKALMPRSPSVKRNLTQAQSRAGLKMTEKPERLLDRFLLKSYLSLPERLQLFAVFTILTLIFASAWLWIRGPLLSKISALFLAVAFIFLVNLTITYYFSPVEAVLVNATELRRDAGMEFAQVGDAPILGGTVVEVVGTSPNGRWLKVVVPDGDFGFMPSDAVKFIDTW